ncbi:uncharacterized [Tachysurus ichikawai]
MMELANLVSNSCPLHCHRWYTTTAQGEGLKANSRAEEERYNSITVIGERLYHKSCPTKLSLTSKWRSYQRIQILHLRMSCDLVAFSLSCLEL